MKKSYYPTKYELFEVLKMTNRAFLNVFAQERGIFVTNMKIESLADEISNLYLDDGDLEEIRNEAYQRQSNHALSGFVVKSTSEEFSLPNAYQKIYDNGERKPGLTLSAPVLVSGGVDTYKASLEYVRKKPGRIEFLQDEKSSFDFYIKNQGNGRWKVELDSNRSTDMKELKDLLDQGLKRDQIVDIDQKLLNTEMSIQFFDSLAKAGMDDEWSFLDIKHLTLKKGTDIDSSNSDDDGKEDANIEEAPKEELVGITQAILSGQNLRENSFVKQSVASGYRFNAMTYEFLKRDQPYYIQIKAEFKLRPKVFEVTILNYSESIHSAATRNSVDLAPSLDRGIRSKFWNNSLTLYNELIKVNQS